MSIRSERLHKIASLFHTPNPDFHRQGMILVDTLVTSLEEFQRLLSLIVQKDIPEPLSFDVLQKLFSKMFCDTTTSSSNTLEKSLAYWSLGVLAQWDERLVQHTRQLDLRGLELTILPESLRFFTELESLNLSQNKLQTLPRWITTFQNLSVLNVQSNPLIDLPDGLTTIMLDQYQGKDLLARICELTTLQHLELLHFPVSTLPTRFNRLKNLRSLTLANNTRPKYKADMTYIQMRNQRRHEQREAIYLPYWMLKMSIHHLEVNLTAIPTEWLQGLGELSKRFIDMVMTLDSANITSFSTLDKVFPTMEMALWALGEVVQWNDYLREQITELEVSNTYILDLPNNLTNLTNLTFLDFSGNYLTELPEWLSELEHLQILNLSGNPVRTIPVSLADLPNLQELNLENSEFPVEDQIWLEALLGDCEIHF